MTLETTNVMNTGSDVQSASPDIPEKDQQEVTKILATFHRYKKWRSRYDKNWMEYYKYFRGVQWDHRRPFWRNSEVINFIWQTIQSQVPLQTDVRPKFQFLPREPSDKEFSEVLDSIADADWDKNNWLGVLLEVLIDGWLYGTSISSMHYDPSLDFGIGGSVYKSEDPFYFYPDPNCNEINDNDSEGMFYAKPIDTERVKRRHPDHADLIKSDVEDFVKQERTDLKGFTTNYFNSDRQLPEGTWGGTPDETAIKKTFVIEGYFKPRDVEQESFEEEGEEGEILTKYKIKRKYPQGRHVVIANGVLLVDEPLPYEDGLFPYSKFNNYVLPREFYGVSEVEQLASPQRIFNKLVGFTLDAWALMGNPVWIVDNNSEIDCDDGMVNVPGSVMEKNPGTEVRQVAGVGMNPAIFQVIDRVESWFNKIAGQSDLQSGDPPGGVTAASAIEQLISIQRTRVRGKQRNMDEYLKTVGEQYMNRAFQFYTVPQVYRITNKDGATVFRKFRIDMDQDEDGKPIRTAVFQDSVEENDGSITAHPENSLIIKGRFDIRVKSGSELPFQVADIERKSLALFDRGIIDEEEVLTRLDVPNKEKILQRLQQRQQAAAEQQQAEAQQ